MSMPDVLDVLKTVNEPLKLLIESISSAIGKAYETKHIIKKVNADAHRIKTI